MGATEPESTDVTQESVFRLGGPDVVLEAFPDETIAVHLGTGRYYSLDLMGAETLELLVSGRPFSAVVEHLAARDGAAPDDVAPAIVDFARRLLQEGLVTHAPGSATSAAVTVPAPSPAPAPAEGGFRAPTMTVYSDMEDLLLLDPIHDVDDTGWPVRADAADAESHDE